MVEFVSFDGFGEEIFDAIGEQRHFKNLVDCRSLVRIHHKEMIHKAIFGIY